MSTTLLIIVIVALPAAVFLLGLALMTIGFRGRAIDDHPLCRKCGFDLFGSSGSTRCPECGSEITPDRIRIGHRANRRRPLTIGLILGIPSFLFLAGLCTVVARGTDFEPYKPFWLLLREGDARAVAELNRREFIVGSLSKAQEQRLLAAALDVQGDTKRPWLAAWGNLIEAMRAAKKVPDKDWQRYARQGASFSLEIRPVLRRGDALPIKLLHGAYRMASNTRLSADVNVKRISIDQVRIDESNSIGMEVGFYGGPSAGWLALETFPIKTDQLQPLADGTHRFTADVVAEIRDGPQGTRSPALASFTQPQSLPIKLVPADARTVEMVNDSSLQPKIAACASINSNSTPAGAMRVNGNGIQAGFDFNNPPIDLAFDVFVRDHANHQWKLSPISFHAGKRMPWTMGGAVPGLDSDKVDIVFRSSADAARGTTDLTRIWGGELVLHNVKVIWQPGTARPWDRLGGRENHKNFLQRMWDSLRK